MPFLKSDLKWGSLMLFSTLNIFEMAVEPTPPSEQGMPTHPYRHPFLSNVNAFSIELGDNPHAYLSLYSARHISIASKFSQCWLLVAYFPKKTVISDLAASSVPEPAGAQASGHEQKPE